MTLAKPKAVELYRIAAADGDADAHFQLGLCYSKALHARTHARKHARIRACTAARQGNGVAKDLQRAFECYSTAADSGHERALCSKGVCLWYGRPA